jgi:hypothetical protein
VLRSAHIPLLLLGMHCRDPAWLSTTCQ